MRGRWSHGAASDAAGTLPSAAAEGVPKTREELLTAIADPAREYGLLKTAESTLATPAFKALEVMCVAKGVNVPAAAAAHKKGHQLPDGFFIVKVHSNSRFHLPFARQL